MNFSSQATQRHLSIALLGACGLMMAAMPTAAVKYNDGYSTNYLGSSLSDSRLKVGIDTPENALFVTNGGLVFVEEVYVGEGTDSTDNLLHVSDGGLVFAGSVDTNNVTTGGVYVGDTDGMGTVEVGHSSELNTDYLYIGTGTNESGNVTVSSGGLVTIREQLYVGNTNNSGNTLTLNDGGGVFINETTNLVLSNIAGASEDFNEVNVESKGRLLVGGDVDATSFTATSNLNFKAGAVLGVGGSFTIDRSSIEDSLNILLDNNLSTNTARWDTSEMYVGDNTRNNSLTLTNGAQAVALDDIVYIGNKAAANGNSINVYGSNSVLTAGDKLFVGNFGDNNGLRIDEGGTVNVALDLKVGASSGSDNNTVFIGTNSTLTVGGDFVVGANGKNNRMTVESGNVDVTGDFILGSASANNRYFQTGGTNTVAGDFIIGKNTSATGGSLQFPSNQDPSTKGNMAILRTNAVLLVEQDLTVGLEGGGSILTLQDGAAIAITDDAIIGEAVGNNVIYLQSGAGTQFNVGGDFTIGKSEEGSNRFSIYGGTATIGGNLFLGATTNQHDLKNFIHLETTNATLHVANALHIGASNSVNTLDIVDGAKANTFDLLVGAYEGVTNNEVTVTGIDSTLSVTNQLIIGSSSGSNNTVTVRNGGILQANQAGIAIGAGTDNSLTVKSGGTLKTEDWDFADMTGTATNIIFEGGSTLQMLGTLSGTNKVEGGLQFVLDGLGSSWDTGTNILYVGYESGNNQLTITNGASVSTATNFYLGFDSGDNIVLIEGAGSLLDIGGDLTVGSISNEPTFNPFTGRYTTIANSMVVRDGATATIGGDAYLYNGANLSIGTESQVTVGGDYHQDGFSVLEIGISSNQVQPNLTVEGTAGFATSKNNESYPLIRIADQGITESNVVTIVKAGEITVDGDAASSASILNNIAPNLLLDFTLTLSNGLDYSYIVLDDFITHTIGEIGNLEGQSLAVSIDIEAMADGGNTNASKMVNIIDLMGSSEEVARAFETHFDEKQSSVAVNSVLGLGIEKVTGKLTQRADTTRARMGTASASTDHEIPQGASGPHESGQMLQGWVSGFGTWGSQDETDGFSGYDADVRGFLIGADLSVAKELLVGVAGGSSSASIDKDNGGSSDISTTYGSVYASLGTESWFADAGIIYANSSVDSDLGPGFDTTADYDARNVAVYLGGGKEIVGEYMVFTPQVSVLVNQYDQDAYTEESSVVGREVEGFDELYVRSSIGFNLGFYSTLGEATFKPELRIHWLHEFAADEQSLSYNLIDGDGSTYTMLMQAREEDALNLGVGFSSKLSELLEIRIDLDTQRSANYSDFTASGSLRYQF